MKPNEPSLENRLHKMCKAKKIRKVKKKQREYQKAENPKMHSSYI